MNGLYFLALIAIIVMNTSSQYDDGKENQCTICEKIVKNFEKGLENTANKTYEGGSYDWEKSHLVPFQKSETRLLLIMERICEEIRKPKKCHIMLEENEKHLEEWFKEQPENITLMEYFCIEKTKKCCPKNHFGKNCDECLGFKDGIMCNNQGKCIGDGTRRGNGTCKCDPGYQGNFCEDCGTAFFKNEENKCTPCDKSCAGPCTNFTVDACQGECSEGFKRNETGLCDDINECSLNIAKCEQKQYCMNVPGKYYCRDCHENCETCNGDNENNCLTCVKGYEKEENRCVEIDECEKGIHQCKPKTYCLNKPGSYSCKKCHPGCETECTGPGLEDCKDCSKGYHKKETGEGCEDDDECAADKSLCPDGKYCKNTNGSYKCKKCDEACHLCHDVGPYSCLSCAEGYQMVNGVCKDTKDIKQLEKSEEDDDDEDL